MKHISGNQNCPCMSGKKYKDCCMPIQDFLSYFEENYGWKYYCERYVLNNIYQNSVAFRLFYDNERQKIQKQIIWFVDTKLNSNMRSGCLEGEAIKDSIPIIRIKKVPIELIDCFDAAHEIQHLIYGEVGMPLIQFKNAYNSKENEYLGTVLANTVADPLVNCSLIKYPFNYREYYQKALNIQIPIIERMPKNDISKADRLFLICLYIEKMLDWRLLDSNEKNSFEISFSNRFPNLCKKGNELIEWIDRNKYGTIQEVFNVYNKIIQYLKVDDMFFIKIRT